MLESAFWRFDQRSGMDPEGSFEKRLKEVKVPAGAANGSSGSAQLSKSQSWLPSISCNGSKSDPELELQNYQKYKTESALSPNIRSRVSGWLPWGNHPAEESPWAVSEDGLFQFPK